METHLENRQLMNRNKITWPYFPWASSVVPGNGRCSIWLRSRPFPSKSFPFQHFSYRLTVLVRKTGCTIRYTTKYVGLLSVCLSFYFVIYLFIRKMRRWAFAIVCTVRELPIYNPNPPQHTRCLFHDEILYFFITFL